MKSGTCLLLLASEQDPLAANLIPTIKNSGYDYAEISLARLFYLDEEEIQAYARLFKSRNLPISVFNNSIPKDTAFTGPNADPAFNSFYIARALHLASCLGADLITMSGPNHRTIPDSCPVSQVMAEYTCFMKEFGRQAANHHITLAIEPINDEEHSYISTIESAMSIVSAVDLPNVKTMVDSYHFLKQQDSYSYLLEHIDSIAHIHYAAQEGRVYPDHTDLSSLQSFLIPLLEAGYQGRISFEAYAPCPENDLPAALQVLRDVIS